LKESFAGDSTVPRVNNGLDAGPWRQRADEPELLRTEWTRTGTERFLVPQKRDGRRLRSPADRVRRRQVKANHARKNRAINEGTWRARSSWVFGRCLQTSRRGVALAPALSVQCGWIALTCRPALEPDGWLNGSPRWSNGPSS